MSSFLDSIGERFANAGDAFSKVIATAKKPKENLVMAPQFLTDVQSYKLAALLISKQELSVTKIFMGSHFYQKSTKSDRYNLGEEHDMEIYAMGNAIKIGDNDYYSNELVELDGCSYLLKAIPTANRVEVNYYGDK